MTGVLVTGATGKTGRVLAGLLRERGVPVRAASRRPPPDEPGAEYLRAEQSGGRVRFDWHDPATHQAALRGVDRVYLVPPLLCVDPMPVVGPFLAEADRLGVRRLVLLGSAAVLRNAPGTVELADRVRSRPGWVVLRPSGFMQNFTGAHPLAERIRRHGEIHTAAGAGRLGWIDTRDIAAVAAELLADPTTGRPDLLLTGPKALSYRDTAAVIAERTGRPVRVVDIGADELAARYRAAGMPADFAASLAGVDADIRAGREDLVSTSVLDVTGHPPRTFTEFVDEHAGEWA